MKTDIVSISALLFLAAGCAATPPPCPATPPASASSASAEVPPPVAPPTVVQVVATDPADPTPAALRALPALPRPSPNAEVKQDVGVSEVALSYSSPGKKGRTVWGDLVPYEKVWRAGANAPTKLTVTHDFSFGGKPVPAGSYALFIIPSEQRWTLILNRDPKGAGAFEHDPAQDVARAEVTPSSAPDRERLVYLFENSTDDETELVLDWAGRRGSVPITIDTKAIVEKGMTATLQEAWRPFFNAGRYAFDQGDPSRAIELLDQSIAIRPTWWNHWWAAQAQAKAQNVAKAREHADQALLLGKDDQTFQRFFADAVKKALASWPKS